jgi:methyl-accepting chemotaxis protein
MEAAVAAVEDMSASIMEAIERQSAFTLSVARHIEEAAGATDRIHGSAGKIGQNAMAAADGASEMHDLATSLSARAQDLQHHVSDFITAVADA